MGVAKGDEVLHSAHVGIDLSETQGVSGMVGFRTVMAHPLWQEASKKKKKHSIIYVLEIRFQC